YMGTPPRPRVHELLAAAAYAAVTWKAAGRLPALAGALGYVAYLVADVTVIPQSRFAKRLRNASALLFLLGTAPFVLRALGLPSPRPARWRRWPPARGCRTCTSV